jgi:hypothetical protein
LGVGLTTPHLKKISLLRKIRRNFRPGRVHWINDLSDIRFGTWNVRSMYRAGSLRAVAEVLQTYFDKCCGESKGNVVSVLN